MDIPTELKEYLADSNKVISCNDGEVRQATFFKLSELEEDTFPIESDEWDDEGEPLSKSEYKGFSLIKDVPNYDAFGILVWLPSLNSFGAWDCDHLSLIIFPNVMWSDILGDPTWYINGQWYPDKVEHQQIMP